MPVRNTLDLFEIRCACSHYHDRLFVLPVANTSWILTLIPPDRVLPGLYSKNELNLCKGRLSAYLFSWDNIKYATTICCVRCCDKIPYINKDEVYRYSHCTWCIINHLIGNELMIYYGILEGKPSQLTILSISTAVALGYNWTSSLRFHFFLFCVWVYRWWLLAKRSTWDELRNTLTCCYW